MNFYEVLGVGQTAAADEIKRAYFGLTRRFSPEKDPETFMRIRQAYEVLSDERRRAAYDAQLSGLAGVPDDAVAVIMEADRLLDKGLASDASALLEAKLCEYPEAGKRGGGPDGAEGTVLAERELKYILTQAYLEMDKTGKAVSLAQELAKDDPDNVKYVRIAMVACMARGWTKKGYEHLEELQRLEPENEDNLLALVGSSDHHPAVLGKLVETVENRGSRAPLLCAYVLCSCLFYDESRDYYSQYEQLDLFSIFDLDSQPWTDLIFAANKLVAHSADIPEDRRLHVLGLFQIGVLLGMFHSDRYDIVPQVEQIIVNLRAEHLLQSPAFEAASIAYMALQAVRSGIPKMLAGFSVMIVFSQADIPGFEDSRQHLDEVVAFEFDILMHYQILKPHIKRFRDEFEPLYQHAAEFLEKVGRYNEHKLHDEMNRRYTRLRRLNSRLALSWLGDDDDFYIQNQLDDDDYERSEPVRVIKTGRNEPCPCGSGLKYKKCCGK